jgi:hypothetical protein
MQLQQRIQAFAQLGNLLKSRYGKDIVADWAAEAFSSNNWFIPENTIFSIEQIASNFLDENELSQWTNNYQFTNKNLKIGVIMAGNIPLVGFHDALSVLLAGHQLHAKLSSQDDKLLKRLLEQLILIEPSFDKQIVYAEKLNDIDALIATGSDNTAQHFDYYFKNKPRIVRRNRSSVAILNGHESPETIQLLATDILQYYGMGCRNVSKLLVLGQYDPAKLYQPIAHWEKVLDNHKYQHNYDYNKSIYLINSDLHFDNGFLISKPSELLVSPISVVFVQEFDNEQQIHNYLEQNKQKIQCTLSENAWFGGSLAIGTSQSPGLTDYPDGVDVLDFLTKL